MEQLLLSHEPSSVEDEAPQINQTIAFGCGMRIYPECISSGLNI